MNAICQPISIDSSLLLHLFVILKTISKLLSLFLVFMVVLIGELIGS